eukprot:TRINITY_DN528_c0_g1_i7.p1 TRINITY_DN528_c0_g1~~TRINITY_DN528_c0_g1_i7.p1  ORF type:complete len:548 (-),score=89.86 TRINITY_DN528_c0_g1_i7:1530-3173(-)
MASKESTFSFLYYWIKDGVTGSDRIEIQFSERLLRTLYYETDIGSIPRGAKPGSYPTPKHKNNPNWSKNIVGCYWCGRNGTHVNGICCSKVCILYFHEWCVERVELFQERRFCKLPGCELSPAEANHVCCSRSHNSEYEKTFEFIGKRQLRDLVTKGPSWYDCKHSFDITPPVSTHNTPKPITKGAVRDLTIQMKSNLIYYTDVGPIPRSYKTELSQSYCLTDDLTTNFVLPEVTSQTPKKCLFSEKTDPNELSTSPALIARRSKSINSAATAKTELTDCILTDFTQTPTNAGLFSHKLTTLLYQHTDIGVIPRVIDPSSKQTKISGCYWCESNKTSYKAIFCSSRCWYLLHEWCVRKVEQVCKLCVVPGCEKSRIVGGNCCSVAHIKQLFKLRGDLIGAEEKVELILGPRWYKETSPVSFSSKQGPFYEFSNLYCCSIQVKITWPTVYHSLCSQKLYGTPYYRHIPTIESVRELDTFMESCVRWVRQDWSSVKERLTYVAMLHKFKQNSILRRLLLSTNERQLICTDGATPVDTLMAVRWSLNVVF